MSFGVILSNGKSYIGLKKHFVLITPMQKILSWHSLFYSSDSQPGVRVPLGVREEFAGGTPNFKPTQNQPIQV